MSYLLDTTVISEIARAKPNQRVLRWIEDVPDGALHLSVITVGEIRNGADRLGDPRLKEKLRLWLEQELPVWFEDRLLPITAGVTDRWGRLLADVGHTVPAIDSLLAATALYHGLRLVTRNEGDFRFPGLEVVNPWRA